MGTWQSILVDERIIDAPPTDGLWEDSRTDESQLGASYEDLEWVMDSEISKHAKDPNECTQWIGKELTESTDLLSGSI